MRYSKILPRLVEVFGYFPSPMKYQGVFISLSVYSVCQVLFRNL